MSYQELIARVLPQMRRPAEVDEHKAAEAIRRGEAADRLLKDEELTAAFSDVERVYMDAWRNTDALDINLRERAWVATRLLADLHTLLISRVRDGHVARKRIEEAARRDGAALS